MICRLDNQKLRDDVKEICFEMGHFIQTQNDIQDSFREIDLVKKDKSDIQNGKCTWLPVMAMERGTEEHKNIMKKCDGKNGNNKY